MNANIKKPIIILGAGALLLLLIVLLVFNAKKDRPESEAIRGVTGEPTDIAIDFMNSWLNARKSSTTDPYSLKLASSTALSLELSARLAESEASFRESGNDPVLCQSTIPERLRSKSVFETSDKAQIMILPKDNQTAVVPIVTLTGHDGLWEITNIECSNGEEAPEQGEFSFDREGQLLKSSLKPPLDNQYWHLVFQQNGTFGYTAPLFLSDQSVCKLSNDTEETCRDDMFTETQTVHVQGNMTEAGVEVKRIESVQ